MTHEPPPKYKSMTYGRLYKKKPIKYTADAARQKEQQQQLIDPSVRTENCLRPSNRTEQGTPNRSTSPPISRPYPQTIKRKINIHCKNGKNKTARINIIFIYHPRKPRRSRRRTSRMRSSRAPNGVGGLEKAMGWWCSAYLTSEGAARDGQHLENREP